MVKDCLVSLSDRFYEHKNDGLLMLPIHLKPFPGIPSLSAPIEDHVFQQLSTSTCTNWDWFQSANPLEDVIEQRSRYQHLRHLKSHVTGMTNDFGSDLD